MQRTLSSTPPSALRLIAPVPADTPRPANGAGVGTPGDSSSLVRIELADPNQRSELARLRHEVYAEELGQHDVNPERALSDPLDAFNEFMTATVNGQLVGCISITPPHPEDPTRSAFSIDKYTTRETLPVTVDAGLFEIRLLTVRQSSRGSGIAFLLMYAALRWAESHGATHIMAIGRHDIIDMYYRLGLQPIGIHIQSGRVHFEAMHATIRQLNDTIRARTSALRRLRDRVEWRLDVPFNKAGECYHGGAFFRAIGEDLASTDKRHDIINADVLDAWFDPSPAVTEALRTDLDWLLKTSPPTTCAGLTDAIAHARGVQPENILPGAGSSDLMYLALPRWLNRCSRVLILDPMYGEYAHILKHVIGCRVDRLQLHADNDFDVDPAQLATRAQGRYDLIILVNPNSPTGRHLDRSLLERVLLKVPIRTRVWIDETYIEYVGSSQALERFAAHHSQNVVICKSMSKVYALSGVRAAYLCGPQAVIDELRPFSPPWAVSLPGQMAAIRALNDPEYYGQRYRETHHNRNELARGLVDVCGLEVLPAVANFLMARIPSGSTLNVSSLIAGCREHGLFLRDVSNMGTGVDSRWLRLAVKDRPTNRRMVDIIRKQLVSLQAHGLESVG
ncbi:MAG: aminotransferase class I/II-fold pyridoxal phosphate-dependent enzyme [Planctomycetes bacterium]|nr:aminotransferase class I/II-fold pyridoxal phosphate-dependent enzyme [Planctomycetota bacterium]